MRTAWKLLPTHGTFLILTSLLGLAGIGCEPATALNRQMNPVSPLIRSLNQNQSHPIPSTFSQTPPKSANSLGLRENMLYREARSQLLQKGWQPNLKGDAPNTRDATVRELINLGYPEVKDCSGTGLGPCRFEFTNTAGELLVVSTISQGASNRDRVVWRWFVEKTNQGCRGNDKPCEPRLIKPSTSVAIPNGLYVLGGTDQGLEVSGKQYRYYDELGYQPWRPVSELRLIKQGVIFDGENYWCIPSKNQPGVCTPTGWRSVR